MWKVGSMLEEVLKVGIFFGVEVLVGLQREISLNDLVVILLDDLAKFIQAEIFLYKAKFKFA